jgi:hypothetical protein
MPLQEKTGRTRTKELNFKAKARASAGFFMSAAAAAVYQIFLLHPSNIPFSPAVVKFYRGMRLIASS